MGPKITAYGIIEEADYDRLGVEVGRLIGEGWQPFGSLVAVSDPTEPDGGVMFYQPIVRYEDCRDRLVPR